MNLRKLGVDSMAVAVAFGMGVGLGFVAGYVQKAELEDELLKRGIRRIQRLPDGCSVARWPQMDEYGNTAWPKSWAGWGREVPPGESLPGWNAPTSSPR